MSMLAKLRYFMYPRDIIQAVGLLILMLFGAVFEAAGLGLMLPLILLLTNPAAVFEHAQLQFLYRLSGAPSSQQFLVYFGVAVIIFFIFKALYLAMLYYLQYRYVYDKQAQLASRLVSAYLHASYLLHIQRNSAELLRNANSEVMWIFSAVVLPGSVMVVESLVVVVITALLIVANPVPALAAIVGLAVLGALAYRGIRRGITDLGIRQQALNLNMIKWVNQGLGGIKEAKVLGREDYFLSAYSGSVRQYSRAMRLFKTINEMPRLSIESIVVVVMLVIVVVTMSRGQNVQLLLPTLGLFAMAGIRLMPSFNRIISSLTSIRYYSAAIDAVYKDLRELEAVPPAPRPGDGQTFAFERSITIEHLSYCYPGSEEVVLSDVCLEIPKGRSIAIVGPSGSGKTTLVDAMLGLLPPTRGRICVDGTDIYTNLAGWHLKIGYIPQAIYLCDDTIRRNIAFGLADELVEDQRVWSAIRSAQLEEFVTALPDGLETMVGENGVRLSGGQRQRIGIARALYHDPDVLVLDEATAALDNETERDISRAISVLSSAKTVIAIAHRLTTVASADLLVFLKDGRVAEVAPYGELMLRSVDFQKMVQAGSLLAEVGSR